MADAPEKRINLQTEELKVGAGVSESTITRMGQAVNFVNKKQYDSRGFFLNGPYASGGVQAGVDGAWGILFDVEIVGVMMFNLVAGSHGVTILDVRRFSGINTPAGGESIFSTQPSIESSSGDNAYVIRDVLNGQTLITGSGIIAPEISIKELNAGDMLTLNIDAAQTGGQNCGLLIYYRPR